MLLSIPVLSGNCWIFYVADTLKLKESSYTSLLTYFGLKFLVWFGLLLVNTYFFYHLYSYCAWRPAYSSLKSPRIVLTCFLVRSKWDGGNIKTVQRMQGQKDEDFCRGHADLQLVACWKLKSWFLVHCISNVFHNLLIGRLENTNTPDFIHHAEWGFNCIKPFDD